MSLTDDRSDPELREYLPSGQQKKYLVLSDEERAKGFVQPVRDSYRHIECGTVTHMARPLAETYARDPLFYGGTFCVGCKNHIPLVSADGSRAFIWEDGSPTPNYVGENKQDENQGKDDPQNNKR
jgi:hypothetical protein